MKTFVRNCLIVVSLSLVIVGFIATDMQAQKLSGIPGSFVDVGFGARPVGLGNAYTAVAKDEHSVYWNPAGLAHLNSYITSFTHTNQLRLIEYNYAAIAAPLPMLNHGAGATIIASGDDAMRELSVHLGYAYSYGQVSAGLGFKYRNTTFGKNMFTESDYIVFEPDEINQGRMNQITGDGSGFGLDIGLMYRPSDQISFGLMVRDAVSTLNWNSANQNPNTPARGQYNEGMPTELIIGTAYKVRSNVLVSTDFRPSIYSDTDHVVNIGAEAVFLEMLALRAGTEQRLNDVDDERYALGFGVNVPVVNGIRIRIDYTYLIEHLDNTQRISFAVQF